ncbi:hypothetical protein SKAU_G00370130 [Synaphobranchus kaupii]|uniref:Bcl2-associated agonist of cell death n=1 Tax=Synaphobranchus kaupii TaxID=118154 RepID=A0A9Q1EFV6_SYNKA|nr:hypothetical protein SKAU_G00370130 [Synaphobranchus kaupii]
MTHMFTISDNDSETSDEVVEADQLAVPDVSLSGPALERLRLHSDSQTSSASQGEDEFEEGDEVQPFRGRSRSAPPELWAAMHYGRKLRRMSDEFDTLLLDKGEMKKVRSAANAKQMRTSSSWFSFWRRKETDTEITSSASGADGRSAE